jgi:D-erythronate 2-dehydrogenase
MHVLILGAGGMIGQKLAQRLARERAVANQPITALSLVDLAVPEPPAGFDGGLTAAALDISDRVAVDRCIALRPDIIFHLAAVVSGEAETDFDKGYRVNVDGMRHLLDAIRHEGNKRLYRPRLVFTSSIAVFGAPFPEFIGDEFFSTPLTSYGTQKAISELLLADYSRRGFLDGIAIRLPTICIRPGKPNKAASGFFSNILREPLAGREAVLPVADEVRHWHASPRAAVGFLLHSRVT